MQSKTNFHEVLDDIIKNHTELTHKQIAKKLKISPTTLYHYRSGHCSASVERIVAMVETLGFMVDITERVNNDQELATFFVLESR